MRKWFPLAQGRGGGLPAHSAVISGCVLHKNRGLTLAQNNLQVVLNKVSLRLSGRFQNPLSNLLEMGKSSGVRCDQKSLDPFVA